MADSEVRQKFEAWAKPRSFLLNKDANRQYSFPATDYAWQIWRQAFAGGMRAGEIARWIPVEEKLPEATSDNFKFLVAYRLPSFRDGNLSKPIIDVAAYGLVRNDNYKEAPEGWRWERHFYELGGPCNYWLDQVTHWQPLPAAPEEKKS